ncbi:murein biosynthesis integral membrane protein MurJ [Sneathia sanguinegens]|uniref:murein biosynthesis integral membrane protein MurJ n=1 Tax=Sneathia sanguinegens TaxID=40543 RepID=UPI0023F63A5F|nr:murein biosynthesis integral membrane protein MurJ [Sneathia sanguinegens]
MFRAGFIVMGINMLSRLLGLIREILVAYFYGSSGLTDAYFASAKISNFFTTLLGEGSLGTVFIPLYTEKKEKLGIKSANEFVYSIMNLVFNFTLTTSIITIIFSRFILKYLIGFNDAPRIETANILLKIMAGYLIFIALSGVVASFLNNHKKFIVSTSTALVFNITIIVGTLLSYKTIGIYGLGISFLLSGIFQFLIQLPMFFKIIKEYKFMINLKDPYVKEFFKLMFPTLIGIFGYQINELIDTNFAAFLKVGTISAINYASRLYLLPVGVFAISLSVVIFPSLTIAVVKENDKLKKSIFIRGLNMLAFLIIPSMIVLFFYSKDIISLIFGYGRFKKDSIIMTAEILKCYSIGLLFFSTNHLLTRAHYVHKDRKIPVFASFFSIMINVLLDYLLYKRYTHMGITLATSTAAMVNFIILFISTRTRYINFSIIKYFLFIIKTLIISIICLVISKHFTNIFLKLLIFALVYFTLWSYEIINKKTKLFD